MHLVSALVAIALGPALAAQDTDVARQLLRACATAEAADDVETLHKALREAGELAPFAGRTRGAAVDCLRKLALRIEARPQDERDRLRFACGVARARADVDGSAPLADLCELVATAPQSEARVAAAEVIGRRGPAASAALPTLVAAFQADHPRELVLTTPVEVLIATSQSEANSRVRGAAATAALQIAPHDPLTVGIHVQQLALGNEAVKLASLRSLLFMGPDAAPAVAQLVRQAEGGSDAVAREAVGVLGAIGPAAEAAIPALERLARHRAEVVRKHAELALRSVRSDGK